MTIPLNFKISGKVIKNIELRPLSKTKLDLKKNLNLYKKNLT